MYVQFSFYYGLQSLGFISNNWIEYNSTRAPARYARLILHSQHQLRWGNNPQQISICTINKSINHAPTCAKQPVINLYHKQVHPTMYQVYTNHVSTTHQQWLINMYQHHQLYTSCMCQLINYLSQPCTQHVPQPKSLINFIIQIWFVAQ